MKRMSLSTTKALFRPIEVEIDGEVLTVRPVDRDVQRQLIELDEAQRAGDIDVPYKRLELLLGPHPKLSKLDIRDATALTEYIIRKLYTPSPADMEEEKKASAPGETPTSQ